MFPTFNSLTVTNINQLLQAFNRFQTQIITFFNAINAKPQLDSLTLTNINIVVGKNQIPHTLGKVLTGWTIMDQQIAAPKLFRYAPSNNTTLFLNSDVACTISLIVF